MTAIDILFWLAGVGIGGSLIALGVYIGRNHVSEPKPSSILGWDMMGKPDGDYTAVLVAESRPDDGGLVIRKLWHLHSTCPDCLYHVQTPTVLNCPRCTRSLVVDMRGEVVK